MDKLQQDDEKERLWQELVETQRYCASVERDLSQQKEKVRAVNIQIAAMRNSGSWRITAPYRALRTALARLCKRPPADKA